MRSITVAIPDEAASRLEDLAAREFRRPKDQAAVLLVEAIERASARSTSSAMNDYIRAKTGRRRVPAPDTE